MKDLNSSLTPGMIARWARPGQSRETGRRCLPAARWLFLCLAVLIGTAKEAAAQATPPSVLDPDLAVKAVVTGLTQPTSMAFIGPDDFFILEKSTGKVQRVVNGAIQSTVLDLPVNFGSERGLLGIALHPNFAANGYVYLYWTESPTGADSSNLADLGSIWFSTEALRTNRVDRFVWDGNTLNFDRNLIRLRSYQADAGQPLRGNHNGGVIRFGPDGKLYIVIGVNGRRGWMQNLFLGPPPGPLAPYAPADDQYGGPAPDNNHLTGVIIRLNDDGTAPADNPFFDFGATTGGEAGANLQKIFTYGIRNSFGLTFDPRSGHLWNSQNGDDSFGEINRFEAGSNGGWVQIMGPVSRVAEFKAIETSPAFSGLQQVRWPPSLIADTPDEALSRLFMLPGAHYTDPEFSWRYEVSPTAIGFLDSNALGLQYEGDMFVGGANAPPAPNLAGGFLFRFKLTSDRLSLDVANQDPRLADRVADNFAKYDITESESLLFGRDFGGVTDIQTGPNGNLFVVSISRGAVYEIFRR